MIGFHLHIFVHSLMNHLKLVNFFKALKRYQKFNLKDIYQSQLSFFAIQHLSQKKTQNKLPNWWQIEGTLDRHSRMKLKVKMPTQIL